MILRSPRARRDLLQHYVYIEERNTGVGFRFLRQARETFKKLEKMPMMGHQWRATEHELKGVRVWPMVPKFKKYLIFYRPIEDGIEVLRVVHSAQDIGALLEDENN